MKTSFTRFVTGIVSSLAILAVGVGQANAANIAVFGDNSIDNFLNSQGHVATLVSDAQIATPGFLSAFDALFMTRDGFSFGSGLSAGAAANVSAYVGPTGNIVLLNADFADSVDGGDANIETLVNNSVNFAASSGHGFIGEFNGAFSAVTANGDGFNPIGLISGTAGPLGSGNGGSSSSINLAPAGVGHSVLAGVTLPTNPGHVEWGADMTGVNSSLVLARFDNENPAIIARGEIPAEAPEPASMALLGLGAAMAVRRRRQRRQA